MIKHLLPNYLIYLPFFFFVFSPQNPSMEQALIPGLSDDLAEQCLLRVPYHHLSTVDCVCRRWRHLVRSTDFHARRRLNRLSRPLFIFIVLDGHHGKCLPLFDPTSGTWRLIPRDASVGRYLPCPTVVSAGRYMVSIPRGHISPVRIYDLCTGIWRDGAPMPGPASYFIVAAWDGAQRVFVAVGYWNVKQLVVWSVMCYDVDEDMCEAFSESPIGGRFVKTTFHAGVLHVIDESVDGNEHIMHSLDVSSRSWCTVQLRTTGMGVRENMFTITPDGRMYCCCNDGKLRVRDGEAWRELLELPLNVYHVRYLTSWKGGVLVMGTAIDVPVGGDRTILKMYTAKLEGDEQSLSWTPQRLPTEMKGYVVNGLWIEI